MKRARYDENKNSNNSSDNNGSLSITTDGAGAAAEGFRHPDESICRLLALLDDSPARKKPAASLDDVAELLAKQRQQVMEVELRRVQRDELKKQANDEERQSLLLEKLLQSTDKDETLLAMAQMLENADEEEQKVDEKSTAASSSSVCPPLRVTGGQSRGVHWQLIAQQHTEEDTTMAIHDKIARPGE